MPPSRFSRRRPRHIQTVVISLGSPVGALYDVGFLISGKVGGPRLGGPGHPHKVVVVLHGLGGSLQVPLYGTTSARPIAG